MQDADGADRRLFPRADITVPIEHRAGSFGQLIADQTLDISEGGMYLQTRAWREVGEEIRFRIVTQAEGGVIEGKAEVVRIARDDEGISCGLALRFTELQEPSLSMLKKLVEMHLASRAAS